MAGYASCSGLAGTQARPMAELDVPVVHNTIAGLSVNIIIGTDNKSV